MILYCPGDKEIPIFSCHAGVYNVLIRPAGDVDPRGTDGRFPHIRLKVSDGPDLEAFTVGIVTPGEEVADRQFVVDFDAGTFCVNDPGSLYLTGGNPAVQIYARFLRDKRQEPVKHWHFLTTRIITEASTTIPDYHAEVSSWTAGGGATLEGVPIDLPPGRWSPCIPGTTLTNGRGASLTVATRWWG